MKISTTITKKEKVETQNLVWVDPCKHIECSGIDCEACPLQKAAEEMRKAQETFMTILGSFPVVDE